MAIGQIPINKTVGTQSVSGASGPSKAAPSVNYTKSELGEGEVKTVTDGHTTVKTSAEKVGGGNDSSNDDIARGARQEYFNKHGQWPPCINPSCKSYGRPHKNCLCFGPMSTQEAWGRMAQGGQVCSGPHHESCEHYATGGEVEENTLHLHAPTHALDHIAIEKGLLHLLTKTGQNGRSQNEHQHFEDYLDNAKKGRKTLNNHVSKLIGKEKMNLEPDGEGIKALKTHLDELQQHPEKAFDIGGKLGSILPDHAASLGAKSAAAINYFQALKPKDSQTSPLDPPVPPTKTKTGAYDRQLGIAQNPSLVLHHAKNGTLQKQDLITLNTIYPTLGTSIPGKAGEALIEAKEKGLTIPYIQKQGLSTLMGQPLDSIQTPMAMQAIIRANGLNQAPQSQGLEGKPKKASSTELKQADKTNSLYATQNQDRQIDQRK